MIEVLLEPARGGGVQDMTLIPMSRLPDKPPETAGFLGRYEKILGMMNRYLLLASIPFVLTLTNPSRAQALTVCSAAWTEQTAIAGTKSAIISGPNTSCPTSPITATVTIGTGSNAGQVGASGATWATDLGTDAIPLTSDSGLAIGSPASATTNLSIAFDQIVTNPYFYVSYLNAGESITFANPFSLLDSNGVTTSGQTITGSGGTNTSDDRNYGFVAQLLGNYSQISYSYENINAYQTSFALTTGVVGGTPVPAPLPILGAGVALSQCRRLRRMSQLRNPRADQNS